MNRRRNRLFIKSIDWSINCWEPQLLNDIWLQSQSPFVFLVIQSYDICISMLPMRAFCSQHSSKQLFFTMDLFHIILLLLLLKSIDSGKWPSSQSSAINPVELQLALISRDTHIMQLYFNYVEVWVSQNWDRIVTAKLTDFISFICWYHSIAKFCFCQKSIRVDILVLHRTRPYLWAPIP